MPGSSQELAELYVQFTSKGVDRVGTDVAGIGAKAKQADSYIKQLSNSLAAISKVATAFSFGGALGIGGIAAIASSGTVEAERFAKACELLGRVLGDQLAPYLRAVTDAVINVARWWRSLDLETRQSATRWALLTTVVAGFVAALPLIVSGVIAVVAALGALLSPILLIPTGIAAAVAAIALLAAEGDTFAEKAANMAEGVTTAWFAIRAVVRTVATEIAELAKLIGDVMAASWEKKKSLLTGDFAGAALAQVKEVAALAALWGQLDNDRANGRAQKIFDEEGAMAAKWADKAKAAVRGVANAVAGLGGGGGFHLKFNVGFESLGQTWERLQKAFAQQDGLSLQQQQLGQLKEINGGMQKAAAGIDGVNAKLPLVR